MTDRNSFCFPMSWGSRCWSTPSTIPSPRRPPKAQSLGHSTLTTRLLLTQARVYLRTRRARPSWSCATSATPMASPWKGSRLTCGRRIRRGSTTFSTQTIMAPMGDVSCTVTRVGSSGSRPSSRSAIRFLTMVRLEHCYRSCIATLTVQLTCISCSRKVVMTI